MKKFLGKITIILLGAFIVSISQTNNTTNAASPIKLEVDGWVLYTDVSPQIVNGRALVPIRVISEQLGASVHWEAKTKKITIKNNSQSISLVIGEKQAIKVNEVVALDVSPQIKNGRTLIPMRFVSEALGQSIKWDSTKKAVVVDTSITPKSEIAEIEKLVAEREKAIAMDLKAPQGQKLFEPKYYDVLFTRYVFPMGKYSMYAYVSQDVATFVQNGTIIGQQRFKDKTITEQWGKVFNIQDQAVFFHNYIFGVGFGLTYGTIQNGEMKIIDTLREPDITRDDRIVRVEEEENLLK
ncbi:copper amine oxidase N-terminal domain-containing protein [Cytobacillus depressus]|uniref:Copper amine oxidase N-terminal domain-containing protein n=1 Tax=Cytobacillus depressus TaxID=1602942 RepID=A0A6L3V8J8_9BACI|nr:copper amine oxidase N-terminal domain-containing protein [Cytobacillus depressus]KAB2336675.1 copper amine oxidase N-terminal domain-containing protein [Cytobacillus depressus]